VRPYPWPPGTRNCIAQGSAAMRCAMQRCAAMYNSSFALHSGARTMRRDGMLQIVAALCNAMRRDMPWAGAILGVP